MKSRIVETLQAFSEKSILTSNSAMFEVISKELGIEPTLLHNKSKQLLETIVHNYAAFDISTIDKFNHRIIRVFAYDLNLPVNFEVELDTESVLMKAVDKLIDRAGTNEELTKILVDFAIEKADDDRSWDISYDFNTIAKLLVNENETPYIETLRDKTLSDFNLLKKGLQHKLNICQSEISQLANKALDLIEHNGLEFSNFSRETLPNHFKKAANLSLNGLYNNKLEDNLKERKRIYNKNLDAVKAERIDLLLPDFEAFYLKIKQRVDQSKIYANALKNITPLSVLTAIQQSLSEIKEDEDILLISEFNAIINAEIKIQPAPFIYERIGEKFKHYFIDEFQDTSILQWENLVPLIDNAVSAENLRGKSGSLMLVGDAKQAIYRWRGGRAEQFIDLYSGNNPFFIESKVENLPANYRSCREIVKFNNSLFSHISETALTSKVHAELYKKSVQEYRVEQEGYVNLNFLNIEDETKDEAHCQAVLETLKNIKSNGWQLKDVCIIVRKKKEGIAIAKFLTERGIPIISSETLLINNSPEVQFLNNLIAISINPDDELTKANLLSYLAEHQLKVEDLHSFLSQMMPLDNEKLFEQLASYGYSFDLGAFSYLPIYEAMESAIRAFKLNEASNAYLQFYLDEVLDYSQKYDCSFRGFLTHWESKKKRLSIVAPEGKEAVQIITIHKSKGLEFPIVIFPYANQDIYFDLRPKIWFPVENGHFKGFSHLYLNLNKDLKEFSDLGYTIYEHYRANLELDSINLLYVVLTRAGQQLYVISEMDLDKDGTEKPNMYSGLFIRFLKQQKLWNPSQLLYDFGTKAKTNTSVNKGVDSEALSEPKELGHFVSTPKETHKLSIVTNSGVLWNTQQADAIERGNLVHDIMAKIKTFDDVESAFSSFENSGKLNPEQSKTLRDDVEKLISHPKLTHYYKGFDTVYNERNILTKSGKVLRPDRLVVNEKNEVVIIDYKTGLLHSKHQEQLFDYQYILEEMGFTVTKKYLVYVNEAIVLKEF